MSVGEHRELPVTNRHLAALLLLLAAIIVAGALLYASERTLLFSFAGGLAACAVMLYLSELRSGLSPPAPESTTKPEVGESRQDVEAREHIKAEGKPESSEERISPSRPHESPNQGLDGEPPPRPATNHMEHGEEIESPPHEVPEHERTGEVYHPEGGERENEG